MGRNLYIADWHYNHANMLDYDNRPFKKVEEMNEALVERWNVATTPADTVYVLGDMFWGGVTKAIPVLDSLKGQKVLIVGNHDKCKNAEFRQRFAQIANYLEIVDGGKHVVLCHYPIPCFKNHFHGWYHLYGHVHSSFEWNMMEHTRMLLENLYLRDCNMFNVGAMMPWMDYTPRTLEEIEALSKLYRQKKA